MYGLKLSLIVLDETKDLRRLLSSQGNATDKSMRADANFVRYYYETEVHIFGWVPGSANSADTGTKVSSLFVDPLALTLATGKLQGDFEKFATASRHRKLG